MKILRNGTFNYKYWKLGALATLCNVHPDTIRGWLRKRKIPAPARRGGRGAPSLWSDDQAAAIVEFARSRKART